MSKDIGYIDRFDGAVMVRKDIENMLQLHSSKGSPLNHEAASASSSLDWQYE